MFGIVSKASIKIGGQAVLFASMHLFSSPVAAQESFEPFVYTYPEEPVVSRLNARGEQYRPIQLMADEMFRLSGSAWVNEPVPIFRMYQYLNSGRANFSVLIKMAKLEACCVTSEEPVYLMQLGVYHLPGAAPVDSLGGLIGKSLIVINTYGFGTVRPFLLDPESHITVLPALSHVSAFSMLEAGRAEYFLDYLGPAKKVYDEKQKNDIRYTVLKQYGLFIVLRKDYPDAQSTANFLGDIYRSLDEQDFAE